jgi:hypothetical protein
MRHFAACLAAALSVACSKTPEPPPSPTREPAAAPTGAAPTGAAHAATPAPAQQGGADLAWDVPAAWETVANPSPMRKATYKVKRAEGDPEDAEMSVSQAGGSIDANVQRWVGQFEPKAGADPKRSQRTVGDLKVTVVEVQGTFQSGMPGMGPAEPKKGWALLGAIVETPAGQSWFFKLTGPEKTVAAAKTDFDKLVDGFRLK